MLEYIESNLIGRVDRIPDFCVGQLSWCDTDLCLDSKVRHVLSDRIRRIVGLGGVLIAAARGTSSELEDFILSEPTRGTTDGSRGAHRLRTRLATGTALVLLLAICVPTAGFASSQSSGARSSSDRAVATMPGSQRSLGPLARGGNVYPSGSTDVTEPSRKAPPSANALPGYQLTYVSDFSGTSLPPTWNVFDGAPSGDPGGLWASSHVVVGHGMLQLNAWQDPAHGGRWVTGGLCQCGLPHTYGAFFVRSRLTGPGATQVESLWPAVGWPPEVDFNETFGGATSSMATAHFTASNSQTHSTIAIDMTQWHTWGVVWTPTSLTYTVDGRMWGGVNVASEVPQQPMTLDIQQQTFCASGFACPSTNESVEVDWVAEYSPSSPTSPASAKPATKTHHGYSGSSAANGPDPMMVRPFAPGTRALSASLESQIRNIAAKIRANAYRRVRLVGYCDDVEGHTRALALSRGRAALVERYLKWQLASLKVTGVRITITGDGGSHPVAPNSTTSGRTANRRVVAIMS